MGCHRSSTATGWRGAAPAPAGRPPSPGEKPGSRAISTGSTRRPCARPCPATTRRRHAVGRRPGPRRPRPTAATGRAAGTARQWPRSRLGVNTAPVGLCGLLIQIDPGARGDRRRQRVDIGVKSPVRPQRHGHHAGAAGADHRLVGGVDRLGHDDLVARPGEALHGAVKPALGARHDRDIVGGARPPAAARHPRRDRRAQCRVADDRGIAGAAAAQRRDGRPRSPPPAASWSGSPTVRKMMSSPASCRRLASIWTAQAPAPRPATRSTSGEKRIACLLNSPRRRRPAGAGR